MTRPVAIVGHRGARGLFPENTLEGFRRTVALGVTAIEIDVGVTKDGVVVVHHDPALNTDTASLNGRYLSGSLPLLRDMAWEDIEDFDVGRLRPGSDLAARFPQQVPIDGQRIPTLAETLSLDASVRWTVEMKLMPDRRDWTVPPEVMVEKVLEVVDAAGAAGRVMLQSFDWRAPRLVRRLRPEIACAWLTRAETVEDHALWWGRAAAPSVPQAVAEEGGGTWSPFHTEVTPEMIDAAHRLGIVVVPWTVNEREDMARLVTCGVDGLITDYPDRLL